MSHTPPGEGKGVVLLGVTAAASLGRLDDFPDTEDFLSPDETELRDDDDRDDFSL